MDITQITEDILDNDFIIPNLIIFVFLITVVWFGFEFSSLFLKKHFDWITRVGFAIPLGIVSSSWIFLFYNYYAQFSIKMGREIFLFFLVLSIIFRVLNNLINQSTPKPTLIINFIPFVIIPSLFCCLLLSISTLREGFICHGSVFGDLPFHLNIISSIVFGCNSKRKSFFDFKTPFYSNQSLAYPIIPNFFSASLLGCFKCSFRTCLNFPSYFLIFSLFIILSRLIFQFTQNKISCFFGPYLFLFTGGLGFLLLFDENARNERYTDYVYYWGKDKHEFWFQTIIHILMPQRASLFGLPISYSIILIFLKINFKTKPKIDLFIIASIFIILLPQISGQILIAITQWVISYGLIHFQFNQFWNYFIFGIICLSFGIPQLVPFFNRIESNFLSFDTIWSGKHEIIMSKNFFTVWWRSLGLFFIFSKFHGIVILDKEYLLKYIPSIIVFFLSNFIIYQPWSLDNTKLLYAAWIPLSISVVSNFFSFLWKKKYYYLTLILIFFTCFSGVLATTQHLNTFASIYPNKEETINLFKWTLVNTSINDIMIIFSDYSNPITTLAGRQSFVGYPGWVASHGLNYDERYKITETLRKNPEYTSNIDLYNVQYLVKFKLKKDTQLLKIHPKSEKWKIVYNTNSYLIWKRI